MSKVVSPKKRQFLLFSSVAVVLVTGFVFSRNNNVKTKKQKTNPTPEPLAQPKSTAIPTFEEFHTTESTSKPVSPTVSTTPKSASKPSPAPTFRSEPTTNPNYKQQLTATSAATAPTPKPVLNVSPEPTFRSEPATSPNYKQELTATSAATAPTPKPVLNVSPAPKFNSEPASAVAPVLKPTPVPSTKSQVDSNRIKKQRQVVQRVFDSTANSLPTNEQKVQKKQIALLSSVFVSVAACIAIALFFLSKNNGAPPKSTENAEVIPTEFFQNLKRTDAPIAERNLILENTVSHIKPQLMAFLTSQTVNDAQKYISQDKEERKVFKRFFQPVEIYDLVFNSAYKYLTGEKSVQYKALLKDGTSREIHAFVKANEKLSIDWKSFYLCENTPFSYFAQNLPTRETKVRSYAYVDTYYTSEYPESEYQSIRLTDFQATQSIFAFVKRDSERSDVLSSAFLATEVKKSEKTLLRASFSLKLIAKEPLPIVEIKEVLTTDWSQRLSPQLASPQVIE